MKKRTLFILSLIGITAMAVLASKSMTFGTLPDKNERVSQISSQERVLKEGDKFVERGLFAQALSKYEEGLNPKFISKAEDKRGPIVRKIRFYRMVGNYKAGLKEFHEAPESLKLDKELKLELEALEEFFENSSKKPVYNYIDHLKEKYKASLPPVGYDSFSSIPTAQMLRLYDTLNDYDAGIAYIDGILNFLKEKRKTGGKKDYEIYDRVKTVEQATQCMAKGPKDNSDWHGCKFLREYLLVREAFEKDKAEGDKGRATKALIQSDYFSW